MTSNVTNLFVRKPAAVALQAAMDADLDEVIVIGYRKDRDAPMFTDVNFEDGGTALWLLEQAKLCVLQVKTPAQR